MKNHWISLDGTVGTLTSLHRLVIGTFRYIGLSLYPASVNRGASQASHKTPKSAYARERKHPRPKRPNRPKPMKFHPTTSGLAVSDTGPGPYDAIQFALSSPPGSGVAVEPN
jgi:hypothetical protein